MNTRSRRRKLLNAQFCEVIQQESRWTEEEDEKLLKLMEEFGRRPWSFISSHFNGQKSIVDCYKRWKLIQSLVNGCWTEEELQTDKETLSSSSMETSFPLEDVIHQPALRSENAEALDPSASSLNSNHVPGCPPLESRSIEEVNQLSNSSVPEEMETYQVSEASGTHIDPDSIQGLVALYGSPVDMKQVCDDLLLFAEEQLSKMADNHQTDSR